MDLGSKRREFALEGHLAVIDQGSELSHTCEVVVGMDLLRKHRAVLDIEGGHVVFGGRNGVAIPCSPSARVPLCWRSVLHKA